MEYDPSSIVFSESPVVTFATNRFENVPVILQYGDTPLIEVVKTLDASHTTRFTIYDDSGTKLAVVKGTRMYLTIEGHKANLGLRHFERETVCERGTSTLFQVKRTAAATLKATAELFTPDGRFVTAHDDAVGLLIDGADNSFLWGGMKLTNNTFSNAKIGILLNP